MRNRILQGDCLTVLKEMPDNLVDCVVTSPPYWGLRDYGGCSCGTGKYREGQGEGTGGAMNYRNYANPDCPKCQGTGRVSGMDSQLGLEKTPQEYISRMVEVFREVRRVMKPEGTLWLNIGDSYNGSPPGTRGKHAQGIEGDGLYKRYWDRQLSHGEDKHAIYKSPPGLKPKDLCGVPWMLAFALRDDGWWLRQDIIWSKPNPMPESVTDRCTKSHEYLFLFSKQPRYYWDQEAVREPAIRAGDIPRGTGRGVNEFGVKPGWGNGPVPNGRNIRSVWNIATQPFPEAHFATFPEALVEPCIKAGTSERGYCSSCGRPFVRVVEKGNLVPDSPNDTRGTRGTKYPSMKEFTGIADRMPPRHHFEKNHIGWRPSCICSKDPIPGLVCDPFSGAGTVAVVAKRLLRDYIGIELNPEYIAMSEKRLAMTPAQTNLF